MSRSLRFIVDLRKKGPKDPIRENLQTFLVSKDVTKSTHKNISWQRKTVSK